MGCSVLILAKKEEKNICDCISSCQTFADEIIVIDDFSEDRTKELAVRYPSPSWTKTCFTSPTVHGVTMNER